MSTPILENPYEQVLRQDPLELRPAEQQVYDSLKKGDLSTLSKIALALGGAFLFQHMLASRVFKETVAKTKVEDAGTLQLIANVVYQLTIPYWLGVAVPAAVAGYRQGVREANLGLIPEQDLFQIAEGYAKELGEHFNQVSTEAMLAGFQAQLNRKVPAARAAQQVSSAYGVPPKAMNTLVTVWNTDDPKRFTAMPMESVRDMRARLIIRSEMENRARQIGESESWSTKSQAKQIVWMYGMQEGIIPETAMRTWVTARDEKVCKYCGPLHRIKVSVGESFKTAKGEVWTPPLHINCRCDVILDFASTLVEESEKELVTKAQGGDPYDRDQRGRFASREARRVRPTRETPTKALWDQVNATTLNEEIARQVEESQKEHKLEGRALRKLPPGALSGQKLSNRSLSSLKPIERTLGQQQLSTPKLGEKKLNERRMNDKSLAARKRIEHVLSQIKKPEGTGEIVNSQGTWVPAEFPIVSIVPGAEYGYDDRTVILDESHWGIALGERVFGGHDKLYEELDNYWRNEGIEFLNQMQIESPFLERGGHYLYIDMDSLESALMEAIYGIPRPDSDSLVLEDEEGNDHAVRGYDVIDALALDRWVHDMKPLLVVTNHVRPDVSERKGHVWSNPGKFEKDPDADDLFLEGSHLPFNVMYVKPMDD